MTRLKFHWFLPTNGGDGRQVVGGGHGVNADTGGRPASVPYLGQIARSAEQLGFEAALTPTGAWCEDAWVSTAMLSAVSERLKFLVAFRPGMVSPFLAAQMAGTFQNMSGGRLLLNVVTGGESHEQRMFGDFLDKDARYERCGEFLHIIRALWRGETVTFEGKHLRVEDAVLSQIPRPAPGDLLRRVVARRRRGGLEVRRRLPHLGRAAGGGGREGRMDPQARGRRWPGGAGPVRHPAAHDRAGHLGGGLGGGGPAAGRHQRGADRQGPGRAQEERVGRPGADALAEPGQQGRRSRSTRTSGRGSAWCVAVPARRWSARHTEIADLVEQYAAVGIEEFVLSGYPHLEEAYWFGEGVLPELARRGRWEHPAPVTGAASVPFGSSKAAS